MPIEKILIVDDESSVRGVVSDLLKEKNFQVLAVSSLVQAREQIRVESFDLILSDLRLKDGDGLAFLQEAKTILPAARTMIMTGYASMDSAVEAIHLGVFDYLIKPIDPARLDLAMDRLTDLVKLETENQYLREQAGEMEAEDIVWGESPAMKQVRDMVAKLGRAEATVLIQGESGTGKEVIAHALCLASNRRDKPFVKVNCAAIPANLLESEFFGHEKGSFTGATQRREGRFEIAHEGTLLLDEISEIPPELQVKLLRVLQEREFERVGGNKCLHVDVRVIATTNRNLREEVKEGRFREDLYYRLNVVPIELPSLRDRGRDVLILGRFFLKHFARKHAKKIQDFEEGAITRILNYPWPGNVRELQNLLERAVILSPGEALLSAEQLALPEPMAGKGDSDYFEPVTIGDMERQLISKTLKRFQGNRTRAAQVLGISIRTMRNKLAEYREAGIAIE